MITFRCLRFPPQSARVRGPKGLFAAAFDDPSWRSLSPWLAIIIYAVTPGADTSIVGSCMPYTAWLHRMMACYMGRLYRLGLLSTARPAMPTYQSKSCQSHIFPLYLWGKPLLSSACNLQKITIESFGRSAVELLPGASAAVVPGVATLKTTVAAPATTISRGRISGAATAAPIIASGSARKAGRCRIGLVLNLIRVKLKLEVLTGLALRKVLLEKIGDLLLRLQESFGKEFGQGLISLGVERGGLTSMADTTCATYPYY